MAAPIPTGPASTSATPVVKTVPMMSTPAAYSPAPGEKVPDQTKLIP